MGIAEFIIGRAFARPVGSTPPTHAPATKSPAPGRAFFRSMVLVAGTAASGRSAANVRRGVDVRRAAATHMLRHRRCGARAAHLGTRVHRRATAADIRLRDTRRGSKARRLMRPRQRLLRARLDSVGAIEMRRTPFLHASLHVSFPKVSLFRARPLTSQALLAN